MVSGRRPPSHRRAEVSVQHRPWRGPHETGRHLVGVNPTRLRWLTTFSLVVHARDAAQLLGSRTRFDPQPPTVHRGPTDHPIEWYTAITARHDEPLLPLPDQRLPPARRSAAGHSSWTRAPDPLQGKLADVTGCLLSPSPVIRGDEHSALLACY